MTTSRKATAQEKGDRFKYPKAVRINGVSYPSIRAASQSLGVSASTVWMWIQDDPGLIITDASGVEDHRPTKKFRGIPVEIEGVSYPSMSAASRALGVQQRTLHHRLKNNRHPLTGKRCPSREKNACCCSAGTRQHHQHHEIPQQLPHPAQPSRQKPFWSQVKNWLYNI